MAYNVVVPRMTEDNEVETSEITTLEDYKSITPTEEFSLLMTLVRRFHGKRLVFFNSTVQGGGVALMRHALIRLYKLLNVDAHWYVMLPNVEVFDITKRKFHNVLQGVAPQDTVLTEQDKEIYNNWIKENVEKFMPVFRQADVIVIDDPQPSGMIPSIKQAHPQAKLIYRSHIQIVSSLVNQQGTPQALTWNFLWNNIKLADCFVSHPMRAFIPANVPLEKIVQMPATTDPLDGLNKPLTEETMDQYMALFEQLLFDERQTGLDPKRPYITQIARFDPSKGIPDVIEAFRQLRDRLCAEGHPCPQLVLAGNASIDDPDASPIYNALLDLLKTDEYKDLANDVKLGRLPHIDELLNTILRRSIIALQLSHREGFEIKVTEALMKGKPVVAYKAGGIPLQIADGVDGFLAEVGDTKQVAQHLYDLMTNKELYQKMSEAASHDYNQDYLTVSNAICWLWLSCHLAEGRQIHGQFRYVKDLARADVLQQAAD